MRSRPLLSYFVLAFAISWLIWLPRIASEQGWVEWSIAGWWHHAGAIGPIAAALIVVAVSEGGAGLRSLAAQYRPGRVRTGWWLFALLSPLALFAVAAVADRLAGGEWLSLDALSRTEGLPDIGLIPLLLVQTATFGIGEETGWRGYALPRLQARHRALPATLWLALGWGLWHVPSFFENPGYSALGPIELLGWAIGLALGAVLLTWLYNSTRGGLLAVVAWHGLFNTLVAAEASDGLIAGVMTAGVMGLAIVALRLAGPDELRGLSRSAGARQQHRPVPGAQRAKGASPVERTAAPLLGGRHGSD